ncbi:hypothetical protein ACFLZ7_03215 [Nanoarchaeota archaeon]
MSKKANTKKYGHYAFILGVLLAIVAAFVTIPQKVLILLVLGLIIGVVNITSKETSSFLIATMALIVAGSAAGGFASVPGIGTYIAEMLVNFVVLVAPAAVVVSIKAIKVAAQS